MFQSSIGIPAGLRAEFRANVVVHGRETGGVAGAFERFEIELGEIDAIPVEALHHLFETGANGRGAVAVLQVHELSPVELGVLQDGGFFAPLRMIVPELFADVRQFDPGVDQNAVAMAGLDEVLQIVVAFGVGVVEVPRSDVQRADARLAPALGEIVGIGARAIRIIEEGPEAGAAKSGFEAEIGERLHQVGKPLVAVRAGTGRDPEHRARTRRESPRSGALPSSDLWRRRARRRGFRSAGVRRPGSR